MSGSAAFALGFSPVYTLTNDIIIGYALPERAGVAAAIAETRAKFGDAFGLATRFRVRII